jgi:hypothetical protein
MKGIEKFKSLLMLLVFLAGLLGLSLLLTRLLIRIEYPPPDIPRDTEILILGDSHAVYALDPNLIGKTVNFSSAGESYIHNYYKLKWALKRCPSLKTVVLPVDLHSFSDFRKDRIHFTLNWLRYLDYPELGWIKNKVLDYGVKYLDLLFFGFKGQYRKFAKAILKPGYKSNPDSEESPGFKPREGFFFHNRDEKARKRAGRQFNGFNPFCPEMVYFFKRILNRCANHQLRVILLRLPISRNYYLQAEKLTDITLLEARMLLLAQQFPHATVIDFRKIYFNHESGLFWDPQHLNRAGARDLSLRFRDRLVQQGFIE